MNTAQSQAVGAFVCEGIAANPNTVGDAIWLADGVLIYAPGADIPGVAVGIVQEDRILVLHIEADGWQPYRRPRPVSHTEVKEFAEENLERVNDVLAWLETAKRCTGARSLQQVLRNSDPIRAKLSSQQNDLHHLMEAAYNAGPHVQRWFLPPRNAVFTGYATTIPFTAA